MKNGENQYWSSLEELESTPEYLENVSREFPASAQEGSFEVNRRDFLKLIGASFLVAGTACSRKPVEKIIPYVNRPEELVSGMATWYASTCQECAAACGIVVKTKEGRPIKLEGNNVHPVNQGALCARGQSSVLNLYAPGRYQSAVARLDGRDETPIAWNELDKIVLEKLSKAKKVALLTGVVTSPSTKALISSFGSRLNQFVHVSYDPTVPEELALASELTYGQKLTPRYRLDKAKILLSFGADFLGNYLSPVEFAKQFSQARRVDEKKMSRFVAIEGQLSLSGTNADDYFAVKSGDEVLAALALANEIIVVQKATSYASDRALLEVLSAYNAQETAEKIGIPYERLQNLAKELIALKGQGLVLGGALHAKNATELQVVVNLINSALENDGVTLDWQAKPSNQAGSSFADLKALIQDMSQGGVDVLIIDNINPAYLLPESLKFREALDRVSFVIAHAEQANETTALAHVIAASSHYLENWNDASPQKNIYSIAQPVIQTLYDTRSFQESLIVWSKANVTWADYLKSYWQNNLYSSSQGVPFELFWIEILQKGVFDAAPAKNPESDRISNSRAFAVGSLTDLNIGSSQGEFALSLYSSVGMSDGRSASNPWLQELPDPVSKVVWDNYLALSPKAASSMSIKQGDVIRVKGDAFEFDAPALIQPKLSEKSVAIAMGYGRTVVGIAKENFAYLGGDMGFVGQNVGINVVNAQQISKSGIQWGGIGVSLAKTGKIHKLAITQGHHTLENRPIVQDTTFNEFLSDPSSGIESHGEHDLTLWPKHEYKGYKWGMAVDMSACTGCNACMIGCQVENNVPVVGREQVIKGRDMHWIRIDRYYKGDVDQPEVAFQPMFCQHCDNAPCETVCPVLATVHNDEGINVMVYNRCVGTRYCANNCPYKVRRFNFMEYSEQMKAPLNMVLNPDLSVREQGVMEKCTFCWQRIREVKDYAKDQSREVRDGEVRTACQQTCPSDAIVFGNLNDSTSRVAKLAHSQRGYHVLEFLNTKPQVTYLTKVRNKGTA